MGAQNLMIARQQSKKHGCDVKRRHEELNTAIEKCFAHDTQEWILLLKLIHNIYIYKVQCCPAPLKSGTGVLQTRRDNQYVFLLTQSLVN